MLNFQLFSKNQKVFRKTSENHLKPIFSREPALGTCTGSNSDQNPGYIGPGWVFTIEKADFGAKPLIFIDF